MTIHEPTSHKIARVLVLILLAAIFIAFSVINVTRLVNSPTTQVITYTETFLPLLPSFTISPVDNTTLAQFVDCRPQRETTSQISYRDFYTFAQQLPSVERLQYHVAWELLQLATPQERKAIKDQEGSLEGRYSVVQSLLYRYNGTAPHDVPKYAMHAYYMGVLLTSTNWQRRLRTGEEDDAWGVYTIKPNISHITEYGTGPTSIVCMIGGFSRIIAENSTTIQPNVVGPAPNAVMMNFMPQLDAVNPFLNSWNAIPVYKGMHTVLTYDLRCDCFQQCTMDLFCTEKFQCNNSHKLSMMNAYDVSKRAVLPPVFANATTTPDDYVYLTVKLTSSGSYSIPLTVVSHVRTYGYLEMLASIFSLLTILLLVYRLIMGHSRVAPFGVMQRYVLRNSTKKFIDAVHRDKQEQEAWLEKLLFTFYLKGDEMVGTHTGLSHDLKRMVRKLKDNSV